MSVEQLTEAEGSNGITARLTDHDMMAESEENIGLPNPTGSIYLKLRPDQLKEFQEIADLL